jgi:hypothetical protein
MMSRMIYNAHHATAKKMHWKEWKRMNRFLLWGSSTRNRIAGMMVTYASAPAMLSESPLA